MQVSLRSLSSLLALSQLSLKSSSVLAQLSLFHFVGLPKINRLVKGQQLLKRNPRDPDCCYYLHCANYDYPVTPDPKNDELNAEDFKNYYEGKPLMEQIHLIPSVTFPNLQQPENNSRILEQLKSKHQVRGKYKEKKYIIEKKNVHAGCVRLGR